MRNEILKKFAPYVAALAIFIAFAVIYCYPILQGKVIQAGDTMNWKCMYQEAKTFHEKTGGYTFWTGSMFSGMPTFQIGGGRIASGALKTPLSIITRLGFSGTLMIIMLYLIGFFILLRSFKVNKWLCIVGAFAITLSSYFFIIIEAGHNTKANTIAMFAPIIAGFFLTYRKQYLWGAVLIMVYAMLCFTLHPQMSYYYCMMLGCLVFAELAIHIKEKRIKDFIIATALFVAAMAVGIGTNFTAVQLNQEYVKETMRGGHSELTSTAKTNEHQSKTSGLSLEYATAWSYGIDETMTLMIPNFKGAASGYNLGTKSNTYEALIRNGQPKNVATSISRTAPTYWGTQPFTSGPVYVGAIICFLFLLGLFIVKGPYKWALLAVTVFSILLSWGKNFMPLTELFYFYFPMYDKFRAVSSILVVAEVAMPLLAFLALKTIMDKGVPKDVLWKKVLLSAEITGGLCLFFALFGGMLYDFKGPSDAQYFSQWPAWLSDAILADRASMLRSDALRSAVFIALAAGAMWLWIKGKMKQPWFIATLGVLVLADMWSVDKRFLNADNFVTPKSEAGYFAMKPYEAEILKDTTPHFRVLNLTTNTFNDARTSYYLKSIGGYHAAKLCRYQDLIDRHISRMNRTVLNMLNTKYVIVPDGNKAPFPQLNPEAMGNAWYVDSLMLVSTPDAECDALNVINPHITAVVDTVKFGEFVKSFTPHRNDSASVKFLSYAPNKLEYQTKSSTDGTVVFSEIYYPYGWHAYIDGQPAEHFRVNYVLRALNVPAGKHHIRFEMYPDVISRSEPVTYACLFILYASLLGGVAVEVVRWRRRKNHIKNT